MFLNMYALCLIFLGVQYTMMSTLQVVGKATRALIVNIGRQTVFFFPILYLFNSLFQFKGLVAVSPVSDVITTMVAVVLVMGSLRKLLPSEETEEFCEKVIDITAGKVKPIVLGESFRAGPRKNAK